MPRIAFNTTTKLGRAAFYRGFILPAENETIEGVRMTASGPVEFCGSTVMSEPWKGNAKNTYFEATFLADGDFLLDQISLLVEVDSNHKTEDLHFDYAAIRKQTVQASYTVTERWSKIIAEEKPKRVLDIGGRARSGTSRKGSLPGSDVIVADIIDSEDVDIVADVHELSSFTDETFDAFMSIATFEHLLMPWKAAIEINKVLNTGAVGLIVTHQTVGIHEVPWDFFRYSDQAWKGIFNASTGFEIIESGMTKPVFIIPLIWEPSLAAAEKAVGYMTSSVLVRKVSSAKVKWPVKLSAIAHDMYPH